MPADGAPSVATADPDSVLDAALAVGALLLACGASTERIIGSTHDCALALGIGQAEVSVSSLTVTVTLRHPGGERSGSRKAAHIGVALATVDAVLLEIAALRDGRSPAEGFPARLAAIAARPPAWSRPAVVVAVAIACGALAGLAGGDLMAILAATAGAAVGKTVQFAILAWHRPPAAAATAAALVSGWLAALVALPSATPAAAVASSVLFLVPGVPLVNGVADLLKGHPVNGLARLANAAVTVLAMAVGLAIAAHLAVHP